MSRRGRAPPTSMSRLGMSLLPGNLVGPQQRLYVVAKSFRHPKHCLEVLASGSRWPAALIGGPCDLIQVPANRTELGHRALQCEQLLLREGRQIPKVRSDQHGDVGSGWHAAGCGPFAQQNPVVWRQTDAEPSIPTNLLQSIELRESLVSGHAKHDLEKLAHQRGFRDLLALSEDPQ